MAASEYPSDKVQVDIQDGAVQKLPFRIIVVKAGIRIEELSLLNARFREHVDFGAIPRFFDYPGSHNEKAPLP